MLSKNWLSSSIYHQKKNLHKNENDNNDQIVLIHDNNKNVSKTCIICFDECSSILNGIVCDMNHYICKDCLCSYVSSIIEDKGLIILNII